LIQIANLVCKTWRNVGIELTTLFLTQLCRTSSGNTQSTDILNGQNNRLNSKLLET
jgi:hypothetical protein